MERRNCIVAGVTITSNSVINIFGYPRSGTTFLKRVLDKLYPQIVFPLCRHTVWEMEKDVEEGNIPIIPFRHPLDAIGSWNIYRQEGWLGGTHFDWHNDTLDGDIKFYLRFNKAVLSIHRQVILMPFEKFADNVDYIKDRISLRFNLEATEDISLDSVKEEMKSDIGRLNLPRETKTVIEEVKPHILSHPLYSDTLAIYQELLKAAEE